jgi:hypothetical protein
MRQALGLRLDPTRRRLVVFLVLLLAVTALALGQAQRWAATLLVLGLGLLGVLWLLVRLQITLPDLGVWTVLVLNPYLYVSLAFALALGGGVGTVTRTLRMRFGWFS